MKRFLIVSRQEVGVLAASVALTGLAATRLWATEVPPTDRYEPGLLPVIAEDADVGFTFGGFSQLDRFRDDHHPYAWRLQVLAATSVRDGATGIGFPYCEAFVRLDRPHTWFEPLRILVRLGYLGTTNLGYFGVGNGTPARSARRARSRRGRRRAKAGLR